MKRPSWGGISANHLDNLSTGRPRPLHYRNIRDVMIRVISFPIITFQKRLWPLVKSESPARPEEQSLKPVHYISLQAAFEFELHPATKSGPQIWSNVPNAGFRKMDIQFETSIAAKFQTWNSPCRQIYPAHSSLAFQRRHLCQRVLNLSILAWRDQRRRFFQISRFWRDSAH